MKLRHIGILCDDIEAMKKWYMEIFNMRVTQGVKTENKEWILKILESGTQVRTCKLSNKDFTIELLKFGVIKQFALHRIDNQGFTHIAITVDNIEDYTKNYHVNPEGTCKVAFINDIENNYIEIVEEIKQKRSKKK